MQSILFYILAAVTLLATLLAISEKHPVHAIVHLVTSFFSLAAIFYLLAAPLIAMFEVIIYAGAVMVLFLFVIMMLDVNRPENANRPQLRQWLLPGLLTMVIICCLGAAIAVRPDSEGNGTGVAIGDFATILFQRYGVAIEIISLQLLFALVGALYLGRRPRR